MRIGGAHKCAWLLAIVSSAFLPGCAQITVVSDGQPPKSEWRFGVLAIDVAPSAENTIVSASGFGLITNPSGASLGYSSARVVRIGDDCRLVVLMVPSEND